MEVLNRLSQRMLSFFMYFCDCFFGFSARFSLFKVNFKALAGGKIRQKEAQLETVQKAMFKSD